MSSSTTSLRDLHQLHQRAKALRDRLTSGPKTLAARKLALEAREKALEEARKALQDEKVAVKKHEHHLQSQQSKSDDLRGKLNAVKKNDEYKAIQNQLALDKSHMDKTEGEILEAMVKVDDQDRRRPRRRARGQEARRRGRRPRQPDRGARRGPEGPARRARQGHHRRRIRHRARRARPLPPDRQAARRRRPRRRRRQRLLGLLRHRHPPDDERADQRRQADLLPELRPGPLSRRGRPPRRPASLETLELRTPHVLRWRYSSRRLGAQRVSTMNPSSRCGLVRSLVREFQVDVVLLVEYDPDSSQLSGLLMTEGLIRRRSSRRFGVFVRENHGLTRLRYRLGTRVGMWSWIPPSGQEGLIVLLHGLDRRNNDDSTIGGSFFAELPMPSDAAKSNRATDGRSSPETSMLNPSSRRSPTRTVSTPSAS